MTEPGWQTLERELDLCDEPIVFWWRDDDAVAATSSLSILLALRARLGIPICLAVISQAADRSLSDCLNGHEAAILVHGWDHSNYRPAGKSPAEFSPGRSPVEVADEVRRALDRLEGLFHDALLPVLVPPFNAFSPHLVAAVRQAGCRAISVVGDLTNVDIPWVNVHGDVICWDRRTAVAPAILIRTLLTALRLRRFGLVRRNAPIGLLTHHLVHDEAAWLLTENVLSRLAGHRCVIFPQARSIFPT